jgi:hypothetical protein
VPYGPWGFSYACAETEPVSEPPKRRHPKKRRNNPKDALDFGRNFTHLTPEKKVFYL